MKIASYWKQDKFAFLAKPNGKSIWIKCKCGNSFTTHYPFTATVKCFDCNKIVVEYFDGSDLVYEAALAKFAADMKGKQKIERLQNLCKYKQQPLPFCFCGEKATRINDQTIY